jgi:hypothetical protein
VAELALDLAESARRIAVLEVLSRHPQITLADIDRWLATSPYAAALGSLTVVDLRRGPPRAPTRTERVLQLFREHPARRLSCGFFVDRLGLRPWTVQKLLRGLMNEGLIERHGRSSAIVYELAAEDPSSEVRRGNEGTNE